jgi:type VI secretion system secreted protein VgrG
MPLYTQSGRPLAVTTPLGTDTLLLEKFQGVEALSQPFYFELDLLADQQSDVAFDKLLGLPISVRLDLPDGTARYFHGIVSQFTQGMPLLDAQGRPTRLCRYQAVMRPRLWLLSQQVQSRIFSQKTVKEVLKTVLGELDVDLSGVQGDFPQRDYCVQYQESDLAFASRLMEEEGIFYFFQHAQSGHKMILGNTPAVHPEADGPAEVPFEPRAENGRKDGGEVQVWLKTQEVRPGKCRLWDYHFQKASTNLEAVQATQATTKAGTATHTLQVAGNEKREMFKFPGRFANRFDGVGPNGNDQASDLNKLFTENKRQARLHMQQQASGAVVVTGESTCRQFRSGYRFTLTRHFNGNGPYVLTHVRHQASLEGVYGLGRRAPFTYANQFEAAPQDLPYCPAPTTPRPVISGGQTAVVVGPSGQDVFTDKYGRVKVQFYWDRHGTNQLSGEDGKPLQALQYWPEAGTSTSCWLRVAQNWAGSGWGALQLPRVGQEVLVTFLGGDPDQPVVVGSLYNEVNRPPFELPAAARTSGIKTQTTGGTSEAFHGLVFSDIKGEEKLHLHSEGNLIVNAEKEHVSNVAGSHHHHVGRNHVTVVGSPPGSGSGGGSEGDSFVDWTIGNVQSKLGNKLAIVYGEATEFIAGLRGRLVLGNDVNMVVNPLTAFRSAGAGWIAPFIGQFGGRNEWICAESFKYIWGLEARVVLGGECKVNLKKGDPEYSLMNNLTRIAVACTVGTFLGFGAAGSWLAQNWDKKGSMPQISTYLLAGAVGLPVLMMFANSLNLVRKKYTSEAVVAAGEILVDQQMHQSNLALFENVSEHLEAPNNQADGTVILEPQTYTLRTRLYEVNGKEGVVISSVPQALPPGNSCILSMNPTPVAGGIKLTLEVPQLTPTLEMKDTGMTLSFGPPAAQGKIEFTANGLTLSFGTQQGKIHFAADGLTLSFGPEGTGSTIVLNAQGITLKSGPQSQVMVKPDGSELKGTNLKMVATAQYVLNATNLKETVLGQAQRVDSILHLQ